MSRELTPHGRWVVVGIAFAVAFVILVLLFASPDSRFSMAPPW